MSSQQVAWNVETTGDEIAGAERRQRWKDACGQPHRGEQHRVEHLHHLHRRRGIEFQCDARLRDDAVERFDRPATRHDRGIARHLAGEQPGDEVAELADEERGDRRHERHGPRQERAEHHPKRRADQHRVPDTEAALGVVHRKRPVAGTEVEVGLGHTVVLGGLKALKPNLDPPVRRQVGEQVYLTQRAVGHHRVDPPRDQQRVDRVLAGDDRQRLTPQAARRITNLDGAVDAILDVSLVRAKHPHDHLERESLREPLGRHALERPDRRGCGASLDVLSIRPLGTHADALDRGTPFAIEKPEFATERPPGLQQTERRADRVGPLACRRGAGHRDAVTVAVGRLGDAAAAAVEFHAMPVPAVE